METVRGKRVVVGLSGGVDSAVTAALLLRAGARVTGAFIKGWYPPGLPCTWAEDRRDAMRVAARLGIPFYTLDARAAYKQGVIDYLLREYAEGRTPNPDVMCNREVKFGAFAEDAFSRGFEYVATGHYARMENGALRRGTDEAKDQSYFLWAVPRAVLAKTLFPLGSMKKDETRRIARSLGLPVAAKKDSQGICFLGSVSVEEFLRQELGTAPGIARDEQGNEIGRHEGAVLATLGQRIALKDAPPGPWYVTAKRMRENELVVAHEPRAATRGTEASIPLLSANWLADTAASVPLTAQYRYHGPKIAGTLSPDRTSFMPDEVLPETPAPGQSLVLYAGETCVGGGIIGE